jgi:hypothetical protein
MDEVGNGSWSRFRPIKNAMTIDIGYMNKNTNPCFGSLYKSPTHELCRASVAPEPFAFCVSDPH